MNSIGAAIGDVLASLHAILFGCVMAYLFYPLARFSEQFLLYHNVKQRAARRLSTAFSTAVFIAMLVLFAYFVLPQLVLNLPSLVENLPNMINSSFDQLSTFLESHGQTSDILIHISQKVTEMFNEWLQDDPLSFLADIASRLATAARGVLNFVIGIIVMVYLLMSRDQFVGQGKKTLYALIKKRSTCDTILRHLRAINHIFSGFVSGKILDSLIIGILCGLSLSILQIPYALLISVIVGVTNIIPVFGPFFGAIPSIFLLLLTDPGKCIIFAIFIVILQQVDGNVIGPKILGDSTGLSAFWVLFSLLLFNHLMGFWGMLLGVPLFASFYYLLREFINSRLRKKNLPTATQDYIEVASIAPNGTIVYNDSKDIEFSNLLHGENSVVARLLRLFSVAFTGKNSDKSSESEDRHETEKNTSESSSPSDDIKP